MTRTVVINKYNDVNRNSGGNKTANINVKKTVVYIQVNGDRSKTAKITNDDITSSIIDIEAMELQ